MQQSTVASRKRWRKGKVKAQQNDLEAQRAEGKESREKRENDNGGSGAQIEVKRYVANKVENKSKNMLKHNPGTDFNKIIKKVNADEMNFGHNNEQKIKFKWWTMT